MLRIIYLNFKILTSTIYAKEYSETSNIGLVQNWLNGVDWSDKWDSLFSGRAWKNDKFNLWKTLRSHGTETPDFTFYKIEIQVGQPIKTRSNVALSL